MRACPTARSSATSSPAGRHAAARTILRLMKMLPPSDAWTRCDADFGAWPLRSRGPGQLASGVVPQAVRLTAQIATLVASGAACRRAADRLRRTVMATPRTSLHAFGDRRMPQPCARWILRSRARRSLAQRLDIAARRGRPPSPTSTRTSRHRHAQGASACGANAEVMKS